MSRPRIRKSRPLTAAERQRRRRRKLRKIRRIIARHVRGRMRRRISSAQNLWDLGPILMAEGMAYEKASDLLYSAERRAETRTRSLGSK